ncbi:MAG: hypothetical protein HY527_07320 [Betaproteobacteria bacterium]|nr:hypothetical protein [Betaproteobacteria bacterium]
MNLNEKVRHIALPIAPACPPAALAMGLMPRDEGKAAWESLEGRVLETLGGSCKPVNQPAERIAAASTAGAMRDELPVNKVVVTKLHTMDRVEFVLGPEKRHGKPQDAGGLLALTPPVTGKYVLGTVSRAWIDVVDPEQNRFAVAKPYQWVDFCGRRMKAGIFDLRAGTRYWIQMSASPDPRIHRRETRRT